MNVSHAILLAATMAWSPGSPEAAPRTTNSLGMEFVSIEPGSFARGSGDGEWDERPVHQVTITRPLFMATTEVTNAQYEQFDPSHRKYGMFAALSFDEGETSPVKKLLTGGGPPRKVDGGGNTHEFIMDTTHAEPAGYHASTQTPDGMIHLTSSRWHYRFNLAWLKEPVVGTP